MKLLVFLFLLFFLYFSIFGSVSIGYREPVWWERVLICLVASAIIALVIGLPVLGIYALIRI